MASYKVFETSLFQQHFYTFNKNLISNPVSFPRVPTPPQNGWPRFDAKQVNKRAICSPRILFVSGSQLRSTILCIKRKNPSEQTRSGVYYPVR